MKRGTALFPHWVQNIACIYLLLFLTVLFSFSIAVCCGYRAEPLSLPGRFFTLYDTACSSHILGFINTFALICICFSRESVEDEFVSSRRMLALQIVALFVIIMKVLQVILSIFGAAMQSSVWDDVNDFSIWMILYFIVFKITGVLNSLKHDEQD